MTCTNKNLLTKKASYLRSEERNVTMKTVNRILEKLDRIFDFLGSDVMFYIIVCWFVLIFISVTYQIFIIN